MTLQSCYDIFLSPLASPFIIPSSPVLKFLIRHYERTLQICETTKFFSFVLENGTIGKFYLMCFKREKSSGDGGPSIVLSFKRQKQEDLCEFEARFKCIVSSRTARTA